VKKAARQPLTSVRNDGKQISRASRSLPPDAPHVGGIIADKYRIEELLGRGGMGLVFKAAHLITGKRFAIKWLLPDSGGDTLSVERFIREAQVAGRFNHPNVVEVYDVGEARGSFYMVMELLEGESLETRVLCRGAMPAREVIRIVLPCARGVARAHAAGIVHRDLKPANIFLRKTDSGVEVPKVLDFGISKRADKLDKDSAITKTGTLLGTPYYMAPEQVHGKNVDPRTDVYAFGVILYQLVSGKLPFEAASYSSLLVKILTDVPTPLDALVPELPRGFSNTVRRAMARDPAARYQTMEGLIEALEMAETSPSRSRGPSLRPLQLGRAALERAPEAQRRVRAASLALLALVSTGLIVAWLAGWLQAAPDSRRNDGRRSVAAESAESIEATEAPPRVMKPDLTQARDPAQPAPAQAPPTQAAPPRLEAAPPSETVALPPLPRGIDLPPRRHAPSGPPAQTLRGGSTSADRSSKRATHLSRASEGSRNAARVRRSSPRPGPGGADPAQADESASPPLEKPAGRLGVQMKKDDF
jgi:eukaryotic-like serine/threonine-protein kinase